MWIIISYNPFEKLFLDHMWCLYATCYDSIWDKSEANEGKISRECQIWCILALWYSYISFRFYSCVFVYFISLFFCVNIVFAFFSLFISLFFLTYTILLPRVLWKGRILENINNDEMVIKSFCFSTFKYYLFEQFR